MTDLLIRLTPPYWVNGITFALASVLNFWAASCVRRDPFVFAGRKWGYYAAGLLSGFWAGANLSRLLGVIDLATYRQITSPLVWLVGLIIWCLPPAQYIGIARVRRKAARIVVEVYATSPELPPLPEDEP